MPSGSKLEDCRDILLAARKDSRRRFQRRLLAKSCAAVMLVGILNFICFAAGTAYLGGDGVNGKVEDGVYYVWGYSFRDHEKVYREVSKSAFYYSRWHAYSVLVTWPLVILAGAIYGRMHSED